MGPIPVVVIVQSAVVDHGGNEWVLMLCSGEGGGEGVSTPTHPRPAHWGRSAHVMRAIVVAIGVKEDAEARKVVPRTKDRTWQWKMKEVNTCDM